MCFMCYLCMGAVSCAPRRILSGFAYLSLVRIHVSFYYDCFPMPANPSGRTVQLRERQMNQTFRGRNGKCERHNERNEKSIFTLGRDLMLTHPCRAITKAVRAQWAANEEKKLGLDSVIWISFYLQALPRGPPVFILNHDGPKRRENWNRFEKVSS